MKKLLLPLLILLSWSEFVHAQKLIQAHKVIYDEQLRPVVIVDLNNKLKKKVTHIIYKFLMTDMSGWGDTGIAIVY